MMIPQLTFFDNQQVYFVGDAMRHVHVYPIISWRLLFVTYLSHIFRRVWTYQRSVCRQQYGKISNQLATERNTNNAPDMRVSINGGMPKLSISMGFSLVNPPFWGTFIYGNPHFGAPFSPSDIRSFTPGKSGGEQVPSTFGCTRLIPGKPTVLR